jgi:RNA polymerase sigma factor (sigma-70 family)
VGIIAARCAHLSVAEGVQAGATLAARGEFSIIIAGLGVAVEPRLGSFAAHMCCFLQSQVPSLPALRSPSLPKFLPSPKTNNKPYTQSPTKPLLLRVYKTEMETATTESELYLLAQKARAGDKNALSLLAEHLRPTLFTVAFSHTRHFEDAQDAVANALLRMCRHIAALRDPMQVRAWAIRIVRNEASRLPQKSLLYGEHDTAYAPPDTCLTRIDVERALRALPRDQGQAAVLHYLHGLPVAVIASRLSRPEGTVKYWLFRSRTYLAHTLTGYAPMNPTDTLPSYDAAIFSSDLPPTLVAQMTQALKTAGFRSVHFIQRFADLAHPEPGQNGLVQLRNPVPQCRYIVLDETINGHSAFEVAKLLRATPEGKEALLFLLADGTGNPKTFELTALAAYMAGFDMLLSKPFDIAEFTKFARRLRESVENT